MLGNRHNIFSSCLLEQLCPFFRIKAFRLEHRNKILVAEAFMLAIGRDMMVEFLAALNVHITRVPLASECGNGIQAPMDENAELRFLIPARYRNLT
ncbi:hypothetical protein D3C78_981390 [compost metagenome]